ncbi:MAG: FAD-dependent oxidoreductase, partial [Candidatus Saccharimonadales bacterium]
PELLNDLKVDVVIVGAGITGLTAGYLLQTSGMKVAVLEQDTLGSGTTGRTTGKVTSQHGLVYADMQNKHGKKLAHVYAQANQAAVDKVAEIIEKEGIDCDWEQESSYVFTDNIKKVSQFKQEVKAASKVGLPASFEAKVPLPFKIKAAVKFTGQGKMNAQKYLLGLAQSITKNGGYVFEKSKAIGIREGNPCRVRTSKAKVFAKHIIVATKVPTFPLAARFGYGLLEYPTESFGIAGKTDKKQKGMYISPDPHHHSIMQIEQSGQLFLIIVGAGGNIPGMRLSKKSRYELLANYAKKHYGLSEITHAWSDMDYLPYDGIPLVGRLYPWSKNLYTATGFMKWGLSNGTAGAMIMHDLIIKRENPWASFYNPIRLSPIKSIPAAIKSHIISH